MDAIERSLRADGKRPGTASEEMRHRRRMRGLFALGVRSIGGSERGVADLAGIDLRTIRADRTSPGLACVGRVGALLGLPAATACAIVAAHGSDAPPDSSDDARVSGTAGPAAGGREVRAAPAHGPVLAALARADAIDDLPRLESLLPVLLAPPRPTGPHRDPKPTDLGLALCVSARLAAARGDMSRVEPLLSIAVRAGVPRRAAPLARRLARQARADLALGAPWLACPHDLGIAEGRSGAETAKTVERWPTRFLPTRLLATDFVRRAGRATPFHRHSTTCPQVPRIGEGPMLALARHALSRLDAEASEVALGPRADSRAKRRAAWCAATAGLLGVRLLERATAAGGMRGAERATTVVVRAQLALDQLLATATGGLRTLVLSRAARLQLAEWALRMRLGEVRPEDLEPPERAELAALLHRFPAACGSPGVAASGLGRSSVHPAIGS